MKKIFFILLFIAYFSKPTLTQWVLDYEFNAAGNIAIRGLSMVDSNLVWLTTLDSAFTGRIYKRINSVFYELNSSGINRPQKVISLDSSRAYLGSYEQKIYFTSNSGLNWILRLDENTFSYPFFEVSYVNSNFIVAATLTLDSGYNRVYISSNGGVNWVRQNINLPAESEIFDLSLTDEQHIWLGINCTGLDCPDLRYYYTTNSGINWLVKTFPLISNNVDMDAPKFKKDNQTGFTFAPGFDYYIYKSINSGASWSQPQLFFSNANNFDVDLVNIDSTQIWYWITQKEVFKTSNDGINWLEMIIPLNDPDFIRTVDIKRYGNQIYGWIGTEKGKLFKLSENIIPIGISPISTEIPKTYSLSQNYPNPFNPVTKIKFDLPVSGFVKIIVYDALGREVTTIINQSLKEGKYEVNFNASMYPSGIYFYIFKTSDYTTTKKMILIK